jgi:hypothetical protein
MRPGISASPEGRFCSDTVAVGPGPINRRPVASYRGVASVATSRARSTATDRMTETSGLRNIEPEQTETLSPSLIFQTALTPRARSARTQENSEEHRNAHDPRPCSAPSTSSTRTNSPPTCAKPSRLCVPGLARR